MHDISLHPPDIYGISAAEKKCFSHIPNLYSAWEIKAISEDIANSLKILQGDKQ